MLAAELAFLGISQGPAVAVDCHIYLLLSFVCFSSVFLLHSVLVFSFMLFNLHVKQLLNAVRGCEVET